MLRQHVQHYVSIPVMLPCWSLQAELADKDFAAERGHQVIVISTGPSAATAKDRERDAVQRVATQAKHQHRYLPNVDSETQLASL